MPSTRRFLSVLAVSICALALVAPSAGAATVTSTNDSGPGSLRQAVIDAAPGETITVPAGTYTLTTGPMAINKSLTIAGAGAGSTVIRGGTTRIFAISGPAVDVTISGLTIRDTVRVEKVVQGGLITNVEANLSLIGVVITANTVDTTQPAEGAGVIQGGLLSSVDSNLTIRDSKIVGNTLDANGAPGQPGGVIQGGPILYVASSASALTIEGSSISDNLFDVSGGPGAPSATQNGGVVQGGAVLVTGSSTVPATIRNSSIAANTALAPAGPGGKGGTVQGGALLVTGSPVNMIQSTLAANVARTTGGTVQGGGALLSLGGALKASIVSSTIVGNTSDGGGISSAGGNLYLTKGVSFANTVVAGGVGPAGSENCFSIESPPTSLGFNLESSDQCNFHGAGDRVNTDPQLGPLSENGGPTPTLVPAPTSPLVDQGAAFGLTTDQRGVIRPIELPSIPNAAGGDGSDIGAVELQPSNKFSFGKLKKNKKKGTARLTVKLPSPSVGTLRLSGKGLKPKTIAVTGAKSSLTLIVATKGKAKRALREKGKRKVAIKVTYSPTANAPLTKVRKAKLVRKQQPQQ